MQKLLTVAKWTLIALVVLGLARTLYLAVQELHSQHLALQQSIAAAEEEIAKSEAGPEREVKVQHLQTLEADQQSIWKLRPWHGVVSLLLAILGILPAGLFWRGTLVELGYATPWMPTMGLYYAGNLGKYVPGKAMVVLLRTGGLRRFAVPAHVAIMSIFIETLLSMAVAASLGGLALVFLQGPGWLIRSALIMVVVTAVPTLPPIFRQVIRLLWRWKHRKRNTSAGQAATSELAFPNRVLTWRLWFLGWMGMGLGWLLLAASLWTLLLGVASPARQAELWTWHGVLVSLAAATLSVVAGFVSLIPGGAGVREYVLSFLVAPLMGAAPALAVAVWMRLVSLLAEFLLAAASGGLQMVRQLRANQAKPAPGDSPPL